MSADSVLALLLPLIAAQRAPALWVLDEHGVGAETIAPNSAVAVLSNRVDVAQAMGAAGWGAHFSDFDFSPWPEQGLDAVFLRLAKEKPGVHHVVNAAAERLARELQADGLRVVLAYADCGTYGALGELCTRLGLRRLPGLHCYDVFAGWSGWDKNATPGRRRRPGRWRRCSACQ